MDPAPMLYAATEWAYAAAAPWRFVARATRDFWGSAANPAHDSQFARKISAAADLFTNVTRRYGKPEWRIHEIEIEGAAVAVVEEVVWTSPWCRLVHFVRDASDMAAVGRVGVEPAVLIVAPMSGHYATLLRGTVQAFLQDHDVYVTDWVNAREVSIGEGRFGFADFVGHVRSMITAIGPGTHVVAVCQPGPPVVAAAALMAEDADPHRPASMTLMGSPIDARLAPTAANDLAEAKPFAWFASNMIHTVPAPYPGALRRVYPGFVQLYAFMNMNTEKHQAAHRQYFKDLVKGDGDHANKHLEFYDEYLSVLDLTEEFYLETVDYVFQRHLLARGELDVQGRRVRPERIVDTALMTVEGEDDDISGVGQTQAAHMLLSGLAPSMRELYVQPHVGHYGVFNGRRFRDEIYPRIRGFIAAHDDAAAVADIAA